MWEVVGVDCRANLQHINNKPKNRLVQKADLKQVWCYWQACEPISVLTWQEAETTSRLSVL